MRELREQFEAFLAGDDAAFLSLYREVNPRLSAYCHKLSHGNAEDLMQELWERVIAMRSKRSDGSAPYALNSPLAFLFRMLRNLSIDEHRKMHDEMPLASEALQAPCTSEGEQTALETIIIEALEKLPASDREILVLNFYSGYKFGEIADMLGMTNDAVWQRASRARRHLRTLVEGDAQRMGVPLPASNASSRTKEIA